MQRLLDRLRNLTSTTPHTPSGLHGRDTAVLLPRGGYVPTDADVTRMAGALADVYAQHGHLLGGRCLLSVQLHADSSGLVVPSWCASPLVLGLPARLLGGVVEVVDPERLTDPGEQPPAYRTLGELVCESGTPRQGLKVGARLVERLSGLYATFDLDAHESGFLQAAVLPAAAGGWAVQVLYSLNGDDPQRLSRHAAQMCQNLQAAWGGRWRHLPAREAGADAHARAWSGLWQPSSELVLSSSQVAGWLLPPAAGAHGMFRFEHLSQPPDRLPHAAAESGEGDSWFASTGTPRPTTTAPASPRPGAASPSAPAPRPETPLAPKPASDPATPRPGRAALSAPVLLGTERPHSAQSGSLGYADGRKVVLDLNETHTISLFGVQGGGKSYTLGAIAEMASLPIPGINTLPHPLATIIFHYSQTQDYEPEFTSMAAANNDPAQLQALRDRYSARPQALNQVALLVPADQLAQRRAEHPDLVVRPLKFSSSELRAEHWRFLMGAVGNQATYIRQLQRVMRAHRHQLNLEVIRSGVEDSSLPDHLKQLAEQRLDLAAAYIDDQVRIKDLIRPGQLVIVDLRDEFIEKDEALGLFVVLMQLFAEAQDPGGDRFNKLVVFDEAHKYIDSPNLVAGLVESVREMRHKGMSVLVASQDPPSVPTALIELSNHIILHKFTSPAWLRHVQKANVALAGLTPAKMAALAPGEAYVWSSKASDAAFTEGAVKITCRPRVTRHGGTTKTAAASGQRLHRH